MGTPTPRQPNPCAPPRGAVADVVDATAAGEPARRATRALAVTVDELIFALAVVPALIGAVRHSTTSLPSLQDFYGPGFTIALVGLAVWLVVTLRFMQQNGQSIGKRLFGIKVIRKDGSRASLARLFWLRNVVNMLPGLVPVVGTLYALVDGMMIYGEPRQCLHDKIADTIVVKA